MKSTHIHVCLLHGFHSNVGKIPDDWGICCFMTETNWKNKERFYFTDICTKSGMVKTAKIIIPDHLGFPTYEDRLQKTVVGVQTLPLLPRGECVKVLKTNCLVTPW